MKSLVSKIKEIDEEESELHKLEIAKLINEVPNTLPAVLIGISQTNNYAPLDFEEYYKQIIPSFSKLVKPDGTKYKTCSVNTVRTAMYSNRLFYKGKDGKYALCIKNAVTYLSSFKKKSPNEDEEDKEVLIDDNDEFLNNLAKNDDTNENEEEEEQDILMSEREISLKYQRRYESKLRRRLQRKIEINSMGLRPFEKIFDAFRVLLKACSHDKFLYSQLTFDFIDFNEKSDIVEKKINADKIIGILAVF